MVEEDKEKEKQKRHFSRIVCSEPIQTVFIDGFQGMGSTGETFRINLAEDKFNPVIGEIERHIVLRLVLQTQHFFSFAEELNKIAQRYKAGDSIEGGDEPPKEEKK